MKTLIQILILIFTTIPCQSQDIKVYYENFDINIPGRPGPWIKFNGKYYCYFSTDNDIYSSDSHQFYILDKNGEIISEINVPKELQTHYYDLYIKNDTIFTTAYRDHNTFYLDLTTNTWLKTEKGIDLYYDDEDYSVYSLDFGEWGGVTWFKNKQTNNQYEAGATTPIVNKLNDTYYLTSRNSILKIADPKKLDESKEPYDYKKAVIDDKRYFRLGNNSTNGAEIMFQYKNNDYFNRKFSLATSFISDNKLYHLYKDSISAKIGALQNNNLVPVYTFKSGIRPFHRHYDTRNRIQNNNYQTIQFNTDNDSVYGIIEINEGDIKVSYFKNTYKEPVFGEEAIKEWFENSIDFYFSNFSNLTLDQIDKVEKEFNATYLTQIHNISHYLLEGKDVQTLRIFRKIQDSELRLLTMYYYTTKEKQIELIKYEWGENKNKIWKPFIPNDKTMEILYRSKFDWISNCLQNKFGKPRSSKTKKKWGYTKWEKENIEITLQYDKWNVELTIYKK